MALDLRSSIIACSLLVCACTPPGQSGADGLPGGSSDALGADDAATSDSTSLADSSLSGALPDIRQDSSTLVDAVESPSCDIDCHGFDALSAEADAGGGSRVDAPSDAMQGPDAVNGSADVDAAAWSGDTVDSYDLGDYSDTIDNPDGPYDGSDDAEMDASGTSLDGLADTAIADVPSDSKSPDDGSDIPAMLCPAGDGSVTPPPPYDPCSTPIVPIVDVPVTYCPETPTTPASVSAVNVLDDLFVTISPPLTPPDDFEPPEILSFAGIRSLHPAGDGDVVLSGVQYFATGEWPNHKWNFRAVAGRMAAGGDWTWSLEVPGGHTAMVAGLPGSGHVLGLDLGTDLHHMRIDEAGGVLWSSAPSAPYLPSSTLAAMETTHDGGGIVVGHTTSGTWLYESCISHGVYMMSGEGVLQWATALGGWSTDYLSIIPLGPCGYATVRSYTKEFRVIRLSPEGKYVTEWRYAAVPNSDNSGSAGRVGLAYSKGWLHTIHNSYQLGAGLPAALYSNSPVLTVINPQTGEVSRRTVLFGYKMTSTQLYAYSNSLQTLDSGLLLLATSREYYGSTPDPDATRPEILVIGADGCPVIRYDFGPLKGGLDLPVLAFTNLVRLGNGTWAATDRSKTTSGPDSGASRIYYFDLPGLAELEAEALGNADP